jgi:hypothetical protein
MQKSNLAITNVHILVLTPQFVVKVLCSMESRVGSHQVLQKSEQEQACVKHYLLGS